jgi:hypothetical protein
MNPRPLGWPATWDWFDPTEVLESVQQTPRTPKNQAFLELLENVFSLQQEPARFVDEYLHNDELGCRPPAYKDILFGFDDVELIGWSASCGPADAPAKYAIAISAATFLQHYLTLDRLLAVPTLLSDGSTQQRRLSQRLQFLQVANGDLRYLFDGSPKAPAALGMPHHKHSLMRQLLVYCPFFLFLHELSHIEGGHLDYRSRQKAARRYWSLQQIREARAKESRVLEFLADSHAILRGAEMVLSSVVAEPLPVKISHLKQFGVAVGLNFLLAEMAEQYSPTPRIVNDPELKDHPNAGARLVWCMYLFSDGVFAQMWPCTLVGNIPSKEAKEAVKEGIIQIVNAWDSMGWKRSAPDLGDPALGPLMSEISKQLEPLPMFNWPRPD